MPKQRRSKVRKKPPSRFSLLGIGSIAAAGMFALIWFKSRSPSDPNSFIPRRRGVLTFNHDIAPIIQSQCLSCHREGQSGPFSLLTYQDVRKRAQQITKVTQSRFMPPWLPSDGFGEFSDKRRLTEDQIGMIKQWWEEGAVEGSPSERPTIPQLTDNWQLGHPDFVAQMTETYVLPAGGRDVYRNFVIPTSLKDSRLVKAIEFRPNTKVVHHVLIQVDQTGQSRRLDAQDAGPGFGGMAAPPSMGTAAGYFLSWQPGRGPTKSPNGLPWTLAAGCDLVVQMHMRPSGKPEEVQPSIGIYFTDQVPTNTPFKIDLRSYAIDIPAGARDYELEESYVLPTDVELLAVLPHAHYLGKEMQSYAILPDGRKEWLLKINQWDFNWQSDYRYAKPVFLPKGSRLVMRFTYDNSSDNPRNPNQPPIRVKYGLQSTDEMGELWFQMMAGTEADFVTFQAEYQRWIAKDVVAFNTLMIQQNPTNAHAYVQLAKAMYVQGKRNEAIEHLRHAVRLDPSEEEAHYHLGVLAMELNQLKAAETEFFETLRINPRNFMALNNLGLLLMHQEKFDQAAEQFRAALRINPEDPLVKQNLELLAESQRKSGNLAPLR